ncbi:MAG: hypothetical protein GX368_01555 [Erysipelotrichaceae bacterium]|nr:hypothetical protein [Erysipelotrichaceae bacterium]
MFWMFVMAFVIIFISFLCGFLTSELIDFKNDNHHFVTPLGFTILIGILQILYYPIQIYNLPTKYIYMVTIGLFLTIIFLSLIKIKRLIIYLKDYFKLYKEIIFGLVMFTVLVSIYYYVKFPTRTDDLYFYIPYIINKANVENLTAVVYGQYDFQGFYDFIAMWIWVYRKLVEIGLAKEILPVAIVSWVISIVLFWILAFIIVETMNYVKERVSRSWISWFVAITIFIYTLGAYWYLQTPYIGNSFRRISIVIIFFIISSMLEKFTWRKFIVLELSFISIIAQTSTGFFFVAFILYALMFYYASKNESGYLNKIVLLSTWPMLFAALYVIHVRILVNPLYGTYALLVLFKLDKKIEKIINKTWKILMIVIPLFFGIWTRLPLFNMPTFNISYFDITPNFFDRHAYEGIENLFLFEFDTIPHIITSIFCVFVWFTIIYYLINHIKKERPKDYLAFHIITILLTFFNPWVITFVMSYMTNVVYFRIYDLFFNILTITLFLTYLLDNLNNKQAILTSIVIFILFAHKVERNQTWMFMGFNDDDYNPLYHTNNLEIEVLDRFKKEFLLDKEETTIIASQIYSVESFTDANIKNVKNNLYTYGDEKSNEAEFQRVFYRYEPGLEKIEGDYINACELAQEKNVEYVILDAQYNMELENGIGYCGDKVLEIGPYRVFEMHYDWLEWSKGN